MKGSSFDDNILEILSDTLYIELDIPSRCLAIHLRWSMTPWMSRVEVWVEAKWRVPRNYRTTEQTTQYHCRLLPMYRQYEGPSFEG